VVLRNARSGIADEAHRAAFDIRQAVHEVHDRAILRGIERVDGKVAPFGVGLPVAAESDLGAPPVRRDVAAQRRHLEGFSRDDKRHRAVLDARRHRREPGIRRQPHHVLG
jgi:hypothetical protein